MTDKNESTTVKLPSALYDKIEKKVISLYKEIGICSVPIDPFVIANHRDYILKPFSAFKRSARNVFREMELDGTNYYDPNLHTFVICYDDSKGYERIRFTLMHEIGHIDMGHFEESDLAKKIADYYAGYALAPTPLIDFMGCEDYTDVAKVFKVSQSCADICFQRFTNWERIATELKPYEKALLDMFIKNPDERKRCCP